MRTSSFAVVAVLLLWVPGVAGARGSVDAQVRKLANQSHEQYQKGDYKGAADTLLEAYELKPVPALLFNIARSYEKAGESAKALTFYRRYRDSAPGDADLVAQASRAIDRLEADQRERDKEAAAEQQKKQAAQQAEAQRLATEKARLEQAERDRQARDAAAAQAALAKPAPAPEPDRALPYTLIGVGGAALVGGAVLGLTANGLASDEKASTDPIAKPDLRSQAKSRALVADIAYGVGIAAVATGVVLILIEPKPGAATASAGAEPLGSSAWAFVPQPVVFDHGAGLSWGGAL